jgi:hypothetical protein
MSAKRHRTKRAKQLKAIRKAFVALGLRTQADRDRFVTLRRLADEPASERRATFIDADTKADGRREDADA